MMLRKILGVKCHVTFVARSTCFRQKKLPGTLQSSMNMLRLVAGLRFVLSGA